MKTPKMAPLNDTAEDAEREYQRLASIASEAIRLLSRRSSRIGRDRDREPFMIVVVANAEGRASVAAEGFDSAEESIAMLAGIFLLLWSHIRSRAWGKKWLTVHRWATLEVLLCLLAHAAVGLYG